MSEEKLEARIATVEAQVSNVASTVNKLAATVETNSSDIHASISRLAEKFSTSSKLPWGVLGTWAGVLMSVALAFGALVSYGLNHQIDSVNQSSRERHNNATLATDNLTTALTKLAEYTADRFQGQDTMLQREMKLLDAPQIDGIRSNSNAIDRIDGWNRDHDERVLPLNAAQWAAIKTNKEEIERLREARIQ